jgi:magnesium chelatase accessory protein
MDWAQAAATWPHAAHSSFHEVPGPRGPQRWHVQRLPGPGPGAPLLLLVHGTGASTHSFRALMPLLAAEAEVLAVDLPGHGFSGPPAAQDWSLPGFAAQLQALLKALDVRPAVAIGHSAGAAVLVQAVLHAGLPVPALVALNGAFLPFGGLAAPLLSPLARLLYALPGVPGLFSQRAAEPAVVRRLIEGTGSHIDAEGLALYGRLMQDAGHTRAALAMMAHWELQALSQALPRLQVPLLLLAGERDRAVPPEQVRRVQQRCPQARLLWLPGLGHLAHEEAPALVARQVLTSGLEVQAA